MPSLGSRAGRQVVSSWGHRVHLPSPWSTPHHGHGRWEASSLRASFVLLFSPLVQKREGHGRKGWGSHGHIGPLTFQAVCVPPSPSQCQNSATEREKRAGRYTWEGQELHAGGQFSYQPAVLCNNDNFLQVEPSSLSWGSKRPPWGVVCWKSTVPGGLRRQGGDGGTAGKGAESVGNRVGARAPRSLGGC